MIEIKDLEPNEFGFAASTEEELFSDPWKENAIADFFCSPYQKGLLLWCDSAPAAYVLYSKIASEAEILRIGTKKEFQKRGFAKMLLNALCEMLEKTNCEAVFLEVRKQNAPAIALYETMGFELIGTRRAYYKNPIDDALIYQKKLK